MTRPSLKSRYDWTLTVEVPMPDAAKANRDRAKHIVTDEDGYPVETGVFWRADCDDSINDALEGVMDAHSDVFAAAAKRKGFDRTSTGISARLVSIDEDTLRCEVSMSRTKATA